MAVTIVEIAKRLGLSHSTVSRVLNGRSAAMVSESTRQRVLTAAVEMGYRPNLAARRLRDSRTNTIGVLAWPNLAEWSAVNLPIIQGAHRTLGLDGYELMFAVSDYNGACGTNPSVGNWDGALVLQMPRPEVLAQLIGSRTPLVSVNEVIDGLPSVVCDWADGMWLALEHLWSVGHRRIAFLNGDEMDARHVSLGLRYGAYQQFLSDHGAEAPAGHGVRPHEADADGALSAAVADGATAVVAYDHVAAIDALAALQRMGRRVPGEVSLISFGDQFPVDRSEPPLTVVAAQGEPMGEEAARQLMRLIHGEELGPLRTLVPERLVERRSVAPPA